MPQEARLTGTTRSLIPRRTLFDNPTFFGAKISPDGRWISWLAPVDGVLNVWMAPAGDIKAGEPVTRTKGRPINWQDWSADGRFLMFLNDETGDENHHLFVVDPTTHGTRDVTPLANISVQLSLWSLDAPGEIAVKINDRDVRWHDLYRIDLASGQRTLIWENTDELLDVRLDWHLRPRLARSNARDGGSRLWRIEGTTLRHWRDVPYEDMITTWAGLFNRTNERVLLLTSMGRETAAYYWHDWVTGHETLIAEHPKADCTRLVLHPTTYEVDAVAVTAARQEWVHISPSIATDFQLLRTRLTDFEFSVESQTDDNRRWIVGAHKAEQPATYYLLDRDKQSLTELFRARPALAPYRLAPMHTIQTKSRDGLDLVSYLTLPADIQSDRPPEPLPMILVVHGGPWFRDSYGYRGDHQWLADRGYAVLSVNYRGSTGFGKAFVAASEKQHAAKMHDDLIDMVAWAISEGIAQREKVAIFGASYGGLASFIAATFTPDVFCCSVPVVGITNLQTLLESMPPYWAGFAEFMYRSYGDPRTPEGRALLAERSPIHKVDRIKKPMLIFHGANDVRCKIAESDTIVAAMRAKNIPVTYVVYPDEGHGFQKPPNRLSYIAIAEAFFARHLGGACEPVGRDFDGSSHEVRAGAEILTEIAAR
jgi:dipeptidyl aminopeptidase/acylaminoacyl peptidase